MAPCCFPSAPMQPDLPRPSDPPREAPGAGTRRHSRQAMFSPEQPRIRDVVNTAAHSPLALPGVCYFPKRFSRTSTTKKDSKPCLSRSFLKNPQKPVRIYEVVTPFHIPEPAVVQSRHCGVPARGLNNIAVLPFANMSGDQEQEYFSDGLTEHIITPTFKIRSLKVISHFVMQCKEEPKPIRRSVLNWVCPRPGGSVQRYGEQVHITAQLIDAATDEHLWADSFDQPVVIFFHPAGGGYRHRDGAEHPHAEQKAKTQTMIAGQRWTYGAYDLYLRGKFLVEKRNRPICSVARGCFSRPMRKDDDFAAALARGTGVHLPAFVVPWLKARRCCRRRESLLTRHFHSEDANGEILATLGYWHCQSFPGRKRNRLPAVDQPTAQPVQCLPLAGHSARRKRNRGRYRNL